MRATKNYIPSLREKVLHFYSNIIIPYKTSKAYFLYSNLSQGGYFYGHETSQRFRNRI
nr:MAG TPA: hypothetical protein [Caudoviricetes sp.]DAT19390.1 MAG TPA: hypothetical protein [Caudoviricetes sp.]